MRSFGLHQLEVVLNAYLHLDENTVLQLAGLQGKVILLKIEDWQFQFFIVPAQHGLELHRTLDAEPTTTICGKLEALIHLARAKGSNSALFKNRVEVTGDLETGEKIRNILANIDIDWEEKLSQLTGDVFANKLGNFARSLKNFTQQAADTFSLNLTEYLHHEVNLLPSKTEVAHFTRAVSTLRDDVDRLEMRLCLLTSAGSKQA